MKIASQFAMSYTSKKVRAEARRIQSQISCQNNHLESAYKSAAPDLDEIVRRFDWWRGNDIYSAVMEFRK